MKKLLLILSAALMFAFVGCESFGGDDVVGGSYNMSGAIQKGPFVQGSNITIQPLNSKLKPIGQMYTTLTTNDAGMFEMEGVNSKYAEIIATGYYYDEVEGKISASPLTLRSIADLKDGAQTNVNILTSLTYNRIKNLVTNNGKGISEAQEQAEKELYTALGIPAELQPNVSCGAMNIANNGEGDGLLLALSAILQEGRSVGELTEYISKFATDLADDGRVEQTLLEKFNLDGQHLLRFEGRIKENLEARYKSLGIECNVPEFSQYLSYLGKPSEHFIIPFTYYEDKNSVFPEYADIAVNLKGIEEGFGFSSDVEYIGYAYNGGYGEIYLSAAPTVINRCSCDVLRTIELPDSVVEIGELAFYEHRCLEKINIPDSVTSIGKRAFTWCWSLSSINIPEGVTKIRYETFCGCLSLERVTIPNSVISIGESAFSSCTNLVDVVIGNSVTEIGVCAFYACTSLESVNIPNSVTLIGWEAFAGTNLKCINIPDSVTEIGVMAFLACHSLANATIGNGVTKIGEAAFMDCYSLTSIVIPDSVTSIGVAAFYGCYFTRDKFINNTSIHDAESSCNWGATVCDVIQEDGLCIIGTITVACKPNATSVTIPDSVVGIGTSTFYLCENIISITIPENIIWIGGSAFHNCSSLIDVYCKPTTPPAIEIDVEYNAWNAFDGNADSRKIYVPAESVDAYKAAEGWKDYADYIVGYNFE